MSAIEIGRTIVAVGGSIGLVLMIYFVVYMIYTSFKND